MNEVSSINSNVINFTIVLLLLSSVLLLPSSVLLLPSSVLLIHQTGYSLTHLDKMVVNFIFIYGTVIRGMLLLIMDKLEMEYNRNVFGHVDNMKAVNVRKEKFVAKVPKKKFWCNKKLFCYFNFLCQKLFCYFYVLCLRFLMNVFQQVSSVATMSQDLWKDDLSI